MDVLFCVRLLPQVGQIFFLILKLPSAMNGHAHPAAIRTVSRHGIRGLDPLAGHFPIRRGPLRSAVDAAVSALAGVSLLADATFGAGWAASLFSSAS